MRLLLRIAFWVACVVVAVLSLAPVDYLPSATFNWWDKSQHALAFFVLGLFGLGAYVNYAQRVVIGLLAFAAAIELAQAATGWRYGDWQDWLADAVGLAVACLIWPYLRPLARITNQES